MAKSASTAISERVAGPIRPPRWAVESESGSVSRFRWAWPQPHSWTNSSNSVVRDQVCTSEACPGSGSVTIWPFSPSAANLFYVRISQQVQVTLATAALASGHAHPKRPLSVFTPRVNNGDTGFVPACQSRRVCCRVASATPNRLRPCAGDATADQQRSARPAWETLSSKPPSVRLQFPFTRIHGQPRNQQPHYKLQYRNF